MFPGIGTFAVMPQTRKTGVAIALTNIACSITDKRMVTVKSMYFKWNNSLTTSFAINPQNTGCFVCGSLNLFTALIDQTDASHAWRKQLFRLLLTFCSVYRS